MSDEGNCFQTFDPMFDECVNQCRVRDRCELETKRLAQIAPVDPPKGPVEEEVFEVPDMDPVAWLESLLAGKFELKKVEKGEDIAMRLNFDGKTIKIYIKPKKFQVVASGFRIQLSDGLQTCNQAYWIYKFLIGMS
jgi:hypothetical protein